jgi:hypothetical protein
MYEPNRSQLLRPYSDAPIWVRLAFAEMIPATYFWDGDPSNPRKISEVTIQGINIVGKDLVYVEFSMDWIFDGEFRTLYYAWPANRHYDQRLVTRLMSTAARSSSERVKTAL